jgi:predicted nuclease with TOPRIM domain
VTAWDPSLLAGAGAPTVLLLALLKQQRSASRLLRQQMTTLVTGVQSELKEMRTELKEQTRVASDQSTKIEVVITRLTTLEGQRVSQLEREQSTMREHFHKLADKVQALLAREALGK